MPAEVLCIGETMLMVTPVDGSPLSGESACLLRPGGAESNVAMNLARLGTAAAWASRLGTDPLGAIVLDSIGGAGVDVSRVELTAAAPTGVFFKNPGVTGTTVHYYRAGSAASTMDSAFVDALAGSAPSVVHLTGITPALSDSAREMTEHLLGDRPFGDAVTSFDVNYRPAIWKRPAADELLGYARQADIVFVGLDEAEVLWQTSTAEAVRELIGGAGWLVVKDSDREAVSFGPAGTIRHPAQVVDVVEPVGAGDAFAAGWLAGFVRGLPDPVKLALGHLVAATALRSISDHGEIPPAAELCAELGIDPALWHGNKEKP